MKKTATLVIAVLALGLFSCKKDRVCECTTTWTDPSGDVTTDPADNTTYKDVRMSEAKTLCQKTTYTSVNGSGGTTTIVSDCKLK